MSSAPPQGDDHRTELSTTAAHELIAALLTDDQQERIAHCRRAAECDPFFASWVRKFQPTADSSLDEACSAATENLLNCLAPLADSGVSLPESATHFAASSPLGRLIRRLVELRDLRATLEQRLQVARVEVARNLAYGAGHEINNPLANIAARSETLLADETHPDRRRQLAAIHAQAQRAYEMIADLMLFARPPAPQREMIDLREVVRRGVSMWRNEALPGVTLTVELPNESAFALVDAEQIAVCILCLLRNAAEAQFEGGWTTLSLTTEALETESYCGRGFTITCRDGGPGVPSEHVPHLFDPYFSGREAGRGLGFGLCKVWTIAQAHGEEICYEPAEGGGAEFTLRLPAAPAN